MSDPATIIVTGASKGLGAAIAYAAAANRAQVVLTARSKSALDIHAQEIAGRGGKVLVVEGDVSRYEDCQKIIEQTIQTYGRIDALINNAGTIEPLESIAESQPEAWAQHIAVNVLGPVMMCQLAIPYLRQTHGKVVNVTSHGAEFVIPGASAYSASKAALNRFSKTLAVEEPLLTVLLLIPGEMDTLMQGVIRDKGKGKTAEDVYQYFVDLYQQGKLIPPEKPALAAVCLALGAPHEWSGEIIEWDEERVQRLVKDHING